MVSFTHVIKSPLFSDVLSRQTHIHHTGRFYLFQISCSIGMLFLLIILSNFKKKFIPKPDFLSNQFWHKLLLLSMLL